jgi:hypothetical protein
VSWNNTKPSSPAITDARTTLPRGHTQATALGRIATIRRLRRALGVKPKPYACRVPPHVRFSCRTLRSSSKASSRRTADRVLR